MLNFIKENIKNIIGWKTRRKIVVLSVDDYGNVRLDSKKAREELNRAGLKVHNRFDAYDSLEEVEDLEILYEVLSSVKDKNGKYAVMTPFSVPCNIDFEKITSGEYEHYQYELLPQTYEKLAAYDPASYEGAWQLWKEGLSSGLMNPQFHGREHLNLKVFEEKLRRKDNELLALLKNRSYTSVSNSGFPTISYTAAFDFWEFSENYSFEAIIEDGLRAFEKVFGYRSVHFNAPGGREHPVMHQYLKRNGVRYLDAPLVKKEHEGKGKYKTVINYTGKRDRLGMIYGVRNVVFEPTDLQGINWIHYALRQIESAFRWNRPAIISSHRVNYCGHIDPGNRKTGMTALNGLLKKIVRKWPDVEFMPSSELFDLIAVERGNCSGFRMSR